MNDVDLEKLVAEELNNYDTYLHSCVKEHKIDEYLNHIADKYKVSKDSVFKYNSKVFNNYMFNNTNENQSKIMSLYKTHETFIRKYLKNE